jgi:hypothetical protein
MSDQKNRACRKQSMEIHMTVKFTKPPRIINRSDALELLDILLKAEGVDGEDYALEALKDAIERGII